MKVDFSIEINAADKVWFDASCGKLFIQARDYVNGIEFSEIANEDFESASPVTSFSLGYSGSMVICHHKDGEETWLPVDMWEPGGFTPKNKLVKGKATAKTPRLQEAKN